MKSYFHVRSTKFALLLSLTLFSFAPQAQEERTPSNPEQSTALEPVVVTAPSMNAPLEVHFDPKAPQQPLPANDGAALLKSVPGMSIIRKGGSGGDPMFRGMAASRLNILLDGEQILGGCGGRMDPPTAYIFPDTYDRVSLLKGPQSVVFGPASAGTVLFERKRERFSEPGWRLNMATTIASFDRIDGIIDLKGGNPTVYGEAIHTYARSGDYRDGNGEAVHSRYGRWSTTAIVGLTPDENTRLELSLIRSDAKAAYADRSMDGSRFRRENQAFKFEKGRISGWLDKIEVHVWRNYIDHVMDNYHLRKGATSPMASNPDRETVGGRLAFTLLPSENTVLVLGGDLQANEHRGRSGSPSGTPNDYHDKPRTTDARFRNIGLFSELTWQIGSSDRLIGGLRMDRWQGRDERRTINIGMAAVNNPGAKDTRRETLTGGFIRHEHDFKDATFYAGLGHTERAPDFWEIVNKEDVGYNATSISAFRSVAPEKTTQLDVGATFRSGAWQGFASAFYGKVADYILIESQYAKPAMTGIRSATVARNVDATLWGGEAGITWRFASDWKASASIASVHGKNDSDNKTLGQIPPLEGKLSLDWQRGSWSVGSLLRLVAAKNRYALNQGNIVGQDLGESGGFGVFSINGGYRWNKTTQLTFGIDNLFDKAYAEFISRSGEAGMIQGYDQSTRVNEPGRTWWMRARIDL